MKRFAFFATTAALAGSLLGTGTIAQANSTMTLVPISDPNAVYTAGQTISIAAVLNLGIGSLSSFTVPTAVGYLLSQFDEPSYGADTTVKFTGPDGKGGTDQYTLWSLNGPNSNFATSGKINGETVESGQALNGHFNQTVDFNGVNTTIAVPAGTYTLATFRFTVAASYVGGPLTLLLPTPFGYSNRASDTDGAYQSGVGPTYSINGKTPAGVAVSESLSFPISGQTLIYNNAVPEPSAPLVMGMGVISVLGLLRRRAAR